MGELIFLALLLAVCGLMFVMTLGFPLVQMDLSGGARMFPQIILGFIAGLILIRMAAIIIGKKKTPFVFLEIFRGPRLFFISTLLACILAMRWLGFMIAVSAFLVSNVNFNYRAVRGNFGGAKAVIARSVPMAALVVALYFIFTKALTVLLPAGILGI